MWLVVTKVPGQLGARAYAELGVDAGQVSGDRLDAQEQLVGDLPVAASLGYQVGDAPLADGQRIAGRDAAADAGQFAGGLGRPCPRAQLVEHGQRLVEGSRAVRLCLARRSTTPRLSK